MASLQIGLAPSDNPWLGWKRPYGVGAGLQNMGNTCYINAALQCLTYTPPLANYMLSRKHSQNCHGQSFCMFCVMQTHVIRALQQPEKVIQPLRALVAGFHKQKQEDAHEFLMYIVNAMEKSCLLGCKQFDAHSEHSNLIRELFGGHWRSRIKCLECGGTSDTFDPCLDIGLDIKTAPSVERSLSQLVEPEMLDGDNAYHCDVCVKKTPALKSLTLHTSPKVLVLVLKRFSDFSGEKIAKRVLYPERLDVQPFMSQQDSGPLVYTLYAVLVHAGFSCNSGHYFCYIKAANGQWYKMDDAKVTACDVTSVLRQDAYLLFYAQKSAFEEQNDDVAVGRRRSSSGADDRGVEESQGTLKRDSSSDVDSRVESKGETEEISLEKWKLLQDQNRPKSELNLRKVDFTLPSDVVVIHQSKYRVSVKKNHPEKENFLPENSTHVKADPNSTMTGQGSCPGGRARVSKRKNKKGKRSLLVL